MPTTASLELWRRSASFLLVGALWGCSNAVIKQTTTEHQQQLQQPGVAKKGQGSSCSSGRGVWDGLKALVGTKVGATLQRRRIRK